MLFVIVICFISSGFGQLVRGIKQCEDDIWKIEDIEDLKRWTFVAQDFNNKYCFYFQ